MPKTLYGSADLDRAAAALMDSVRATWAPDVKPWAEAPEIHRELARRNVADVLRALREVAQPVAMAGHYASESELSDAQAALVWQAMISAILGGSDA